MEVHSFFVPPTTGCDGKVVRSVRRARGTPNKNSFLPFSDVFNNIGSCILLIAFRTWISPNGATQHCSVLLLARKLWSCSSPVINKRLLKSPSLVDSRGTKEISK